MQTSLACESCSNNTNKLSPQELAIFFLQFFSVQIIQINLVLKNPDCIKIKESGGSNNTNKLSPQEHHVFVFFFCKVQIIQINLVLKNCLK